MPAKQHRSPLGLLVLTALVEEPMHAYRIHALIKARGKDRVVNVRGRASVYQAIDRLQRLGLIAVRESGRVDKRPERTVYEITERGCQTARLWLREMLATTDNEFPEFLVGVSILTGLPPGDARDQLSSRAEALQATVDEAETTLRDSADVPRVFLLEEELRLAIVRAELNWVRSVIDDLRTGRITWDEQWLREAAAKFAYMIDQRENDSREQP